MKLVGVPGMNIVKVDVASPGGELESNQKLYIVPQRQTFANGFTAYVCVPQPTVLAVTFGFHAELDYGSACDATA